MGNTVPDRTVYDPELGVYFHTGQNARDMGLRFGGRPMATDIETPGLDEQFTINCVTFCWEDQGETHSILLDPRRVSGDAEVVREMNRRASSIILHNAPFDIPALVHADLMTYDQINKVVDTVVLARFGIPDAPAKTLAAMSKRFLGMEDSAVGMKLAFAANGWTIDKGYETMDIDYQSYREGAMTDTVATLRLHPVLRQRCWDWSVDHPFERRGATSHGEAEALIERQEMVHRVMLRRTARGINVDVDYLGNYREEIRGEYARAEAILAEHDLLGGKGKGPKIIKYIDELGELPSNWPRTPTGAFKATKELLDEFDHPLATAQRTIASIDQVLGYLEKVEHQARITGRCHSQEGTLAASATGRMSYTSPPLQQFSARARPILIDDGQGLTSIDWSQIEPVTMGILAQDFDFLAPYEAGEDLYGPLMRAAGIDRPTAKIVLLADMYGQGEKGMARRIGSSFEQAGQIRRQIRSAMKRSARWMAMIQGIAEEYGKVVTAGGRILPVGLKGSYLAVNYVVQGTAYDVLANTICEMERQGMGDEIYIAMHDELVVSTPVAEEVQRIMITPPPFFTEILGRPPVLRSDRADTGRTWQKV